MAAVLQAMNGDIPLSKRAMATTTVVDNSNEMVKELDDPENTQIPGDVPIAQDALIGNDVAMAGRGFYNSNCALQTSAMMRALPLFEDLQAPTSIQASHLHGDRKIPSLFTAVDYGCSQGINSILPFQCILSSYTKERDAFSLACSTSFNLVFSDRPSNDFTALSSTISTSQWPTDLQVFPSMVPRSFYGPVMPPRSVHAGFSLAALHHLEGAPLRIAEESEDQRRARCAIQSEEDLVKFLTLRAEEFVPDAPLVLTFVGTSHTGEKNYAPLVSACRNALITMVQDGTLPTPVLACFEVPVYDRSLEEVKDVMAKAEIADSWTVEHCFEESVEHPACEQRGISRGDNNSLAQSSSTESLSREEYARIVVDWEMAVIGGYFVKAVHEALDSDGAAVEALSAEWTERTVDEFLKTTPDAMVKCCFVYLKLRRK